MSDPAEAALWSTFQNSLFKPSQGADGNIKNPHFHQDEFMKYISGVNPYSEEGSAIQADYKMPGYVDAELGIAKENKRVAAEIDEIRLSLGTIKAGLEEARDYQTIDNDELEVAITSIGESMMGTGKDALRSVPLNQVISNIDKAIVTMIEDRDSGFMPDWIGGWQAPTTTVPDFDVWDRDPLTETHKVNMDSIIEANRSKLSNDKKYGNTFGSLNKIRDEAYRLLMTQLMSQKFQGNVEETLDDMPAPE